LAASGQEYGALYTRKEARMRFGIVVLGGALVLGAATFGLAGEVNCKQVNKYLQTGRSVKDVAETMVVSESDVEKCKAADTGGGATGGGGEMKGTPSGQEHGPKGQ
jgi:hypothetical protein